MTALDPLIVEFSQECRDQLLAIESALERLEREGPTTGNATRLKRHFHSLKGAATFAGVDAITRLASEAEDRLESPGAAEAPAELLASLWEQHDAIHAALESLLPGAPGTLAQPDAPAAASYVGPDPSPARDTSAESEAVTLRVKLLKLDQLAELASELVLVRNRVHGVLRDPEVRLSESPRLRRAFAALEQLNRVTRDLERAVMDTRLVEIEDLVRVLPRQVRALAKHLGKQIRCEIHGANIALDKSVIDRLRVPFSHLVRNACDHGIEPPARRVAAGKPAEGRIRIESIQEENSVRIRFEDDGAGIDHRRILECARERGLIAAADAERLAPERALSLIFEAGFSSSPVVTDTSGRGIGLDVVRHEVEALNGTLTLSTVPGTGTCFEIRLPLSLFVVPVLNVSVAGNRFAIPITNVLEVARSDTAAIAMLGSGSQVVYRDRVLPVLGLAERWGLRVGPDDAVAQTRYLLVLSHLGRRAVLPVEEIAGQEELVVRNLSGPLRSIPGTKGLSILGDGSVVPVLDVGSTFDSLFAASAPYAAATGSRVQ